MKQILDSIKPEWVAKILNGEKTLEIRKTAPKEWADYLKGKTKKKPEPMTVFIYCTKDGYLHLENEGYWSYSRNLKYTYKRHGKVVAKFTLDRVFIIHNFFEGLEATEPTNRHITIYGENELLKESCLRRWQIVNYGGVYAWHISDLEIFAVPKELSEFMPICTKKKCNGCKYFGGQDEWDIVCNHPRPLSKAPYSWCYVEERE